MTATRTKRPSARRSKGKKRFSPAKDVPEMASLSCKRSIQPEGGGNFLTNLMYECRNTDLASYDRAVNVAKAYQHFRIKKITVTLKPTFDTYQQNVGTGSRPQLYYMIDKAGAVPQNPTLEALKQMGAKAHRFDEKPFSISWRPSVLTADQVQVGAVYSAQYKVSPWLSTSAAPMGAAWAPSVVDHLGLFWYVEQLFNGNVQYNAEIEVQFQFKKPLWPIAASSVPPQRVQIATTDDSSDGIVGGPDTNNMVIVPPST